MSHSLEDSGSETSENDDIHDYCESNDADSLRDEYEDYDGNLEYNPSDRLVGGSLILHIDQTRTRNENANGLRPGPLSSSVTLRAPFENLGESGINSSNGATNSLQLPQAGQSTSTTTSLSEAASDNQSTRAVLGESPSASALPVEDDGDNSSQTSMTDSDVERVRRIHNSVFSCLEHDLQELVRIREETIQFLEGGASTSRARRILAQPPPPEEETQGETGGEELSTPGDPPPNAERPEPFVLRERLTFHARPTMRPRDPLGVALASSTPDLSGRDPNTMILDGKPYTPIAKFDNAPPAKPAKPYVEIGLTTCDEKAAAAREILDKLQYGGPEDESACFVRRFWRETSTVVEPPPSSDDQLLQLSADAAAALVQRTANLQASLEEAFGGLRLRLQQVEALTNGIGGNASSQTEAASTTSNRSDGVQQTNQGENSTTNAPPPGNSEPSPMDYYDSWDQETSILDNPLNYDIWNELEDEGGGDASPSIRARINLSERRSNSRRTAAAGSEVQVRRVSGSTSTVGVGTHEGAEADNDTEDDEDEPLFNLLGFRDGFFDSERRTGTTSSNNFSPATREFFQDIGISEELGRDIFNMFTLSETDIPASVQGSSDNLSGSDLPQPLFPRSSPRRSGDVVRRMGSNDGHLSDTDDDDEDDDDNPCFPQIPLADATESPLFSQAMNFVDNECSARVYLDENDLNFFHTPPPDQEES